jgi:Nif-specific regulatory protein
MKKGKVEIAGGGTLFLDEIGELAPALQAKLLRILQEREFERVGGTRTIKTDFRLIAATNRDLEAAIKTGSFRSDLYYRLNVVSVTLPPLRERGEDIALLAEYFLCKAASRCKIPNRPLSPEARACLLAYSWPSNVRELENAMERALVLGSGESILPEDLPESILESGYSRQASGPGYHSAIEELKKRLIVDALERSKGNYTEAAKSLGIHPNYLHRLIRNLELRATLNSLS